MSVKTKGNQWCERCGKAVMAVKSTHRLRSISAAAMIPFSVGVSGFAAKRDPYVCPGCGGPVRSIPTPNYLGTLRLRERAPRLALPEHLRDSDAPSGTAEPSGANEKANLFAGRVMAFFAVLLATLLVLGALLAVADSIFG